MAELLASPWLTQIGALVVLVVIMGLADWLTTRMIRGTVRRVASRTKSTWDDRVIERKVFARLAHVVPAMLAYYSIGLALGVTAGDIASLADPSITAAAPRPVILLATLVQRTALAFIVVTGAVAFASLLEAANDIYNESYSESNSRPIKGYLQVVSLIGYIAAGVVVVSVLAQVSPVAFLSGLGALMAVIMLVFKDTILSLVASIQIMSNDMIRIGDWVEVPQANADGDIIDIALHTVKIQNWDKTISTVPTHKFIGESFKNWRGMSESGGRRIKRSIKLDVNTIRFLREEEVERLSRYEVLRGYMEQKKGDLAEHAAASGAADTGLIPERRRLTNIGTFRAYIVNYLRAHPTIHEEMTLLVRQLQPGPQGVPIEIYCFSNDTDWVNYEDLQGDIFDHLFALLPEFGLRAFQEPAGVDFAKLGAAVAEGGGS
jgi:miniconductance mechanosensitive channel